MILKCKNVTKRFGELVAVNSLSFEVEKGEVFGIAGPNGAGKTTVFNLINGIYQGSGDIIFDGENISGLSVHQICHKGIARTFQIPQLFLTLPVFQNVRVGAHFGAPGVRNKMEHIKEAIGFVGLTGKENVIAANLNLLDKKLTMLAAALATKAKLILLDEPIAGLNPAEVRQCMAMIEKVNKQLGLTILIIEHFMRVLTELSHRMMILQNGAEICTDDPLTVAQDRRVIESYLGEDYA
jgi:branched-chain amino acid transport system ATP-binding protein